MAMDNNIFDYIVKAQGNGKVEYFGAIVDSDQEHLQPIPAQLYIDLTGNRDVHSIDGIYRFKRPLKRGADLVKYTRKIGQNKRYNKELIDLAIKNIKNLVAARAFLNLVNVPVKDDNDIFEIFTKYAFHNPLIREQFTQQEYALAIGAMTTGRNNLDFDFGAMLGPIFGTVFDLMGGAIDVGNDNANAHEIAQWIAAYKAYMVTDFGEINRLLAESGPVKALAWLEQLKGTSWLDLKNYNLNWTHSKGMEVPEAVLLLQQAQIDLENSLKAQVAALTVSTDNNPPPFTNPNPSPMGGFQISPMIMIAIAAVAIIFIVKK